jgi:23S rRNA pseudouridine1911/1915/1917 synthase
MTVPSDTHSSGNVLAHELTIPAENAGQRLDLALAILLPEYSRSRLKHWIDDGKVQVNGRTPKPRDLVSGGEKVVLRAEVAPVDTVTAQRIKLKVVYEDDWIIVIDKPAGLVVHPGAGNSDSTMQNALLHLDPSLASLPRSGIVHRLDKDTSGLLVVARSLPAHTALVQQIQAREFDRHYLTVCYGVMTAGGTIDKPIGRHRTDRLRMAIRSDGREAITHYRVVERYRAHTYVRVKLETGRTHQIRVHLSHIGFPIVGDRTYGGRLRMPKGATPELLTMLGSFPRQALHAAELKLEHPEDGREMEWKSPVPKDMRQLLDVLAADRDAADA